ncbi:hypothetical protein [Streptomyces sp. TRM68367]|uniref:hypothetical protein n=1 Tax=Streptomyces sp. TRM68367 TaxID=2758415 RepID=UPI00165C35DB|nr:hypothetical protein [Streptomyces sp. TRM68367]MBC9727736.1 hypothetical protein [Streptomyces sp. TRM68367]
MVRRRRAAAVVLLASILLLHLFAPGIAPEVGPAVQSAVAADTGVPGEAAAGRFPTHAAGRSAAALQTFRC